MTPSPSGRLLGQWSRAVRYAALAFRPITLCGKRTVCDTVEPGSNPGSGARQCLLGNCCLL